MPESAPFELADERVAKITPVLRDLMATLLAWRPDAA